MLVYQRVFRWCSVKITQLKTQLFTTLKEGPIGPISAIKEVPPPPLLGWFVVVQHIVLFHARGKVMTTGLTILCKTTSVGSPHSWGCYLSRAVLPWQDPVFENLRTQLSEFPTPGGGEPRPLHFETAWAASIWRYSCSGPHIARKMCKRERWHSWTADVACAGHPPTLLGKSTDFKVFAPSLLGGPVMVGSLGMEVHSHLGGMRTIETAIRPKLLKSRVDDENRPLSRFAGRQRWRSTDLLQLQWKQSEGGDVVGPTA